MAALTGGRINDGLFTRKCKAVFARQPKKSGCDNEVTVRRGFTVFYLSRVTDN